MKRRHDATIDQEEIEFQELRSEWEKHMKDFTPTKTPQRIEVLLLYWKKISPSHLDTDEEVDRLDHVFSRTYNFNVHRRVLNDEDGTQSGNFDLLLQARLATFLGEHDKENTLIIIYYAGHGYRDRNGESLELRGNNRTKQEDEGDADRTTPDSVTWKHAESTIALACKADFLLIFDCCEAGRLCDPPSYRGKVATRQFEFLAAADRGQLAAVPGPESFTNAMILALEKLAAEVPDGFTTSELWSEIRKCPTLDTDQTPILHPRTNCRDKLILKPLRDQTSTTAATAPNAEGPTQDPIAYSLHLEFLLEFLPSKVHIHQLCQDLKQSAHRDRFQAQKILLKGLHRNGEIPDSVKAIAHTWIGNHLKRRRLVSSGSTSERPPDLGLGLTVDSMVQTGEDDALTPVSMKL